MTNLKEWAESNNRFMVIHEDETYTGVYNGYVETMSTYDPSKKTISYKLGNKVWNSSSKKLAAQMHEIPIGATINIYRKGKGSKTEYTVTVTE